MYGVNTESELVVSEISTLIESMGLAGGVASSGVGDAVIVHLTNATKDVVRSVKSLVKQFTYGSVADDNTPQVGAVYVDSYISGDVSRKATEMAKADPRYTPNTHVPANRLDQEIYDACVSRIITDLHGGT